MSAAYLILAVGVFSDVAVAQSCTAVMGQKYPEKFQNASGLRSHQPFCTRMERVNRARPSCSPVPLAISHWMPVQFSAVRSLRWSEDGGVLFTPLTEFAKRKALEPGYGDQEFPSPFPNVIELLHDL